MNGHVCSPGYIPAVASVTSRAPSSAASSWSCSAGARRSG
jgi:hypothetical protein